MVIFKFFTMGEYDKKEKWINRMCSKGYALKTCGICRFVFEPCNPDEYYYSLELLENIPSHTVNEDFFNYLMDEWNVEYVCKYRNWFFFRRKKSYGKFSLFNNTKAKVYYFYRVLRFRLLMFLLLVGLGLFSLLYSSHGSYDETFASLLFSIALIITIINIPTFSKYIKLKKSL